MSKIFYYGSDDKVYGPFTERDVQGWYVGGYLSSDVKFQITQSYRFDCKERFYTLGELIELNGRTLPFYFSSEKTNREKEKAEKTNRLMKEMDSLRSSHKENQRRLEQNDVVSLKIQLAALNESQENLLRQVKELSTRKEKSPANPQFETKLFDMKKRVDEQEKNFASMKKEISAVTSKCDCNDTKLEKLVEKQKQVDGSMNGYETQISELKQSEKSLRENLNLCEQNVTSHSNQLQSIQSDLNEIKKEMDDLRKMPVESVEDVHSSRARANHEDNSLPPWVKDETKSQPEMMTHNGPEKPWNEKSEGSTKESVPAEKEVKKRDNKEAKAKPTVKDWDAICKELSDDEEEDKNEAKGIAVAEARDLSVDEFEALTEEQLMNLRVNGFHVDGGDSEGFKSEMEAISVNNFIRDSVQLLRAYCEALASSEFKPLRPEAHTIDLMKRYQSSVSADSISFATIRDALKTEIRRLTARPLLCALCGFYMTTPRHLLYHITDAFHSKKAEDKVPSQFSAAHKETLNSVVMVLYKFIASPTEIDKGTALENEFNERGKQLLKKQPNSIIRSPLPQFVAELNAAAVKAVNDELRNLPNPNRLTEKERVLLAKNTLSCEAIKQFEPVLDGLIAEGIGHCPDCLSAFAGSDDYYKHMTTYSHAMRDNNYFFLNVRLWKGPKYWDSML